MISEQYFKELDILGWQILSRNQLRDYIEFLKEAKLEVNSYWHGKQVETQELLDEQINDYRAITNDVDKAVKLILELDIPDDDRVAVLDLLQY